MREFIGGCRRWRKNEATGSKKGLKCYRWRRIEAIGSTRTWKEEESSADFDRKKSTDLERGRIFRGL